MAKLKIRLLGEFRLILGDDDISSVFSPRLQALITFILLNRESPIPRKRIAFRFWPDVPEARAHNNLRQLLYRLRTSLPDCERFLQVQTSTVQWRRDGPARVDLIRFESGLNSATNIAELEEALAEYGGRLLPGQYDDWLLHERERLHQSYVAGREQLATMLEQKGDYEAAVQQLRKLISLEPIRESSYVRLMRVYARLHDRAAVDRLYHDCVAVLQRDLGIEPSPALQKKYERLARVAGRKRQRLHLPTQPTPLIGRQVELLAIDERLQDARCRLVTLVGPGGVGKTRLALEAARTAAVDFIDGVIFVSLAALTSTEQLVATLVSNMDLQYETGQSPRQQLIEHFSGKEILLILDNYEHLLPDTSLVEKILAETPNVSCLVTSRVRLRLRWEWLVDVTGLPVPESDDAGVGEGDAVRLLRYHLRRLGVTAGLRGDQRRLLARIARMTSGMPLALELAAAAARASSLSALAHRLEGSIDALELTNRDTDARHWSVRATFDRSWELLALREQDVLARLAVFRGSFDVAAATSIAGASRSILGGLVEKSLLQRRDETRFAWHELIRQYAERKLRAIPGAWQKASDAHCSHYKTAVKNAKGQDSANRELVTLTITEINNIQQAWQTAVTNADHNALNEFVVGLGMYYQIHTLQEEGKRILHQGASALRKAPDTLVVPSADRQRALGHLVAWLAWMESEPDYRLELGDEAVCLLRPLNAPLELGTALMARGNALRMLDRPGEAVPDFEEAVSLFGRMEELFHLSGVVNLLGLAHGDLGDFAAAERCFHQVLELARDVGVDYVVAIALGNLAWNALQRGEYEEAETWLAERLKLNRQMGNVLSQANALHTAAVIARKQGRLHEAEFHLQRAKETPDLRRKAPETWQHVMSELARVAMNLGKREEARQFLIDGLETWRLLRYRWRSTDFVLTLALWLRDGHPMRAAELLSLACSTGPSDVRTEAREHLNHLEDELPSDALEAAVARGENMDLAESVSRSLSEL